MSKAAEAFRTISEVADELDVQKHVLRFWEARFPQVRPMKRGGGRRYYRPEDMELLRGIRHLLHAEGYTIKGVQKILREQGIDHVKRHGRAPGEIAASVARPAQPDARMLPANVAATVAPQSGRRGAAAIEPHRRAKGGSLEQGAVLEAVIKELQQCRLILLEQHGKDEAVRAPRRARAVGA
jgi:DNA-binding transcriptional MerR regulator